MGEELDPKEKLVREICRISTLFTSCSHIRSNSAKKQGFIDWYLILRVDDDAGSDVIRRRYRELALQIHPDKNRHPKAEVAFKLISEAYECLSDKAGRKAFNSYRKNNFCKECHRKSQQPTTQKSLKDAQQQQAKRFKILRAFKEVQNRLKEECRVIENCLRANEAAAAAGGGMESPLFDPSDRLHFPDYPHYYRDHRLFEQQRQDEHWNFSSLSCMSACRKFRCESPVYQLRSESRRSSWSRSTGFRF